MTVTLAAVHGYVAAIASADACWAPSQPRSALRPIDISPNTLTLCRIRENGNRILAAGGGAHAPMLAGNRAPMSPVLPPNG